MDMISDFARMSFNTLLRFWRPSCHVLYLCSMASCIGFTGGLHHIPGLVHGCLYFLVLPLADQRDPSLPTSLVFRNSLFTLFVHLFFILSMSTPSSGQMMTTVLGRAVFLMIHWFLASSGGSSTSVRLGRFRVGLGSGLV
jgi:hypothetical protein